MCPQPIHAMLNFEIERVSDRSSFLLCAFLGYPCGHKHTLRYFHAIKSVTFSQLRTCEAWNIFIETPKSKRSQRATALCETKRQEVLALTSRLMWYVFLFFFFERETSRNKRERDIGKAKASSCNRRSPILAQRNSKKGLQETNKEIERYYIRKNSIL